ncbi:hypothetical protein Tco_0761730 [Tanacetum coccineum]
MTAFSEDRLSATTTKLGTPLMLDSYTSDMRMESWGRSSYARALINSSRCGVERYYCGGYAKTCCSVSTTPIVERIDKLEKQIVDGKVMLVDDDE